MARYVADSVLDAGLDKIASANVMIACSQQPTSRAEAVTTYALADVAMAAGDFAKADGDASGRKIIVAGKAGVLIDASGDATHIALCNATELLYVTETPQQTLTANGSNTVAFGSWDIELADPAAP